MDENFRKRLRKTLYSGDLEPGYSPFALTDMAVEFFKGLAPHRLGHVDLDTASAITGHDGVSPSSMAMSMMYAKRLQRKRPEYVGKMSSSELFIISMMMASKYLYDEGVDEEVYNDEWAENAGLEKKEINEMELDFLDAMDWELFIRKEDFEQAMLTIERSIALKEGLKRGWFTYADLNVLMDEQLLQLTKSNMGWEWLKVILVSSAAYFAGVMTMVGSTVVVTNVSLALTTSGLLPPAFHSILPPILLSPQAVSSCLAISASPSTQVSAIELPAEMSSPKLAGFSGNGSAMEREEAAEENEMNNAEKTDTTRASGKRVLDTILSQLVAVLTLKSHLVNFVSAVSDGYAATGNAGNGSTSKSPRSKPASSGCHCPTSTSPSDTNLDTGRKSSEAMLSQWLAAAESVDDIMDFVAGSPCADCGRNRKGAFGNGCDADCRLGLSGLGFQECSMNRCWLPAGEKVRRRQFGALDEWQGHNTGGQGRCLMQERFTRCCSKEDLAYFHDGFQDVTVGFSTSVPPLVFAT